jgi:hypothetical protein
VGAFRALKFSKYLARLGVKMYIFTADNKSGMNLKLNKDIPDNAIIIRKKVIIPQTESFAAQNVSNNILNKMKYIIKDFLFSPDKYIWWSISFLPKMIRTIKKERINAIMVCGEPFSTFIPGVIIKKLFNIPLVLDFRDPWKNNLINQKQSFIRRFTDNYWEKKSVKNADLLISVTDPIVDYLKTYKSRGEVIKLTNGFDLEDFNADMETEGKKDKFVFLYTGKYNRKSEDYNPDYVVRAFDNFIKKNNINNCLLIFVGLSDKKTIDHIKNINSHNIKCIRTIPRDKVLEMQKSADVLVHFYYPSIRKDAVSAKVFEYALSCKPIISFNVCEGPLFEFLDKNQLGETASNNNIEEMVSLFEKAYRGEIRYQKRPYEMLQDYDLKNITHKLADKISNLVNRYQSSRSM